MTNPVNPTPIASETVLRSSSIVENLRGFGAKLFDLLSRPQPSSPLLRRRERAARFYKRQVRSRIRLHRVVAIAYSLVCVICVGLTLAFFFTDLIRPHLAPDTPFAGITVMLALFSASQVIYACYRLHSINAEARQFGEFYTNTTNADGTINIDPASDHDYGDRVIDGHVYVRMSEIYDWYCKRS